MKGYAFLDSDFKLQYRTREYIEIDNPFFWQQNEGLILRKWIFDTDDLSTMLSMFRQVRDIFRSSKLDNDTVVDFCTMIGFNMKSLKDAS